jgi:hypothetical protein
VLGVIGNGDEIVPAVLGDADIGIDVPILTMAAS